MADPIEFRPKVVASPSTAPEPGIVAEAEKLLERVRSGEIQALSFAAVTATGAVSTYFETGRASKFDLGCAIGILATRFFRRLTDE